MTRTIYEQLSTLLRTGVHQIVATKVDGTQRTIAGTRDPEILSQLDENYKTEFNKTRAVNTENLTVFDCTSSGWKSFKIKNIISIDGIKYNEIINTPGTENV